MGLAEMVRLAEMSGTGSGSANKITMVKPWMFSILAELADNVEALQNAFWLTNEQLVELVTIRAMPFKAHKIMATRYTVTFTFNFSIPYQIVIIMIGLQALGSNWIP